MVLFLLGILIISCINAELSGSQNRSAVDDSFGYEVSILYKLAHICGAAIVSPRYVITAAHCTDGFNVYRRAHRTSPSELSVKICSSSTIINTIRIYQHPNYNPSTIDFDLSIVHLESDLEGTPIKLPSDNQPIPIGAQAIVSGCGFEPVVQQIVGSSQYITVAGYMFCAVNVEGHEGLCSGASGSPLVVEGELLGVFSWGYGCVQQLPNVYTSIPSLRAFIREITGV